MTIKYEKLFSRGENAGLGGGVVILILICLFFPVLSLIVVASVMNAAR